MLKIPKSQEDNPENVETDNPEPKMPNTIPFPSSLKPSAEEIYDEEHLERDQRSARYKGNYKDLLKAAVTVFEEIPASEDEDSDRGCFNCFDDLPPDIAVVGHASTDPKTLDEVLRGRNAKEWQAALDYEIGQLEKFGTWVVEDLPPGQSAIPCNEVVKVKRGPNGEVQSYRVRIVAGGQRQVEGVNYSETFSAAAKMPAMRAVLANAAHQDWEIEHVDVKSAYLNVPLKETIYMKPPRGVLKPGQEGKVLRLLKGLYGLKQAGRGWYLEMMRVFLKELNFTSSVRLSTIPCTTDVQGTNT
jgi:hypothetical protein